LAFSSLGFSAFGILRITPSETEPEQIFLDSSILIYKTSDLQIHADAARVDLRSVELGPRLAFQQAYEPDEAADNPVIVVLGAGDHGKSTLLGATFANQMDPQIVAQCVLLPASSPALP
jgi:hypothetical protein